MVRHLVGLVALARLTVSITLLIVLPLQTFVASDEKRPSDHAGSSTGFSLSLIVGVLDTATRMGYLLFLPSCCTAKAQAKR